MTKWYIEPANYVMVCFTISCYRYSKQPYIVQGYHKKYMVIVYRKKKNSYNIYCIILRNYLKQKFREFPYSLVTNDNGAIFCKMYKLWFNIIFFRAQAATVINFLKKSRPFVTDITSKLTIEIKDMCILHPASTFNRS